VVVSCGFFFFFLQVDVRGGTLSRYGFRFMPSSLLALCICLIPLLPVFLLALGCHVRVSTLWTVYFFALYQYVTASHLVVLLACISLLR
jgi:hypothetical protein